LFGFADASLAVLPRVSRVRAPPATRSTTARVDRPFCRLAPRTAGGPAPTSPASEPLFRSGRNFLPAWPTVAASDRRVSSLCVDGDRSADGSEGCPRIVRFSTFSRPFFEPHFSPDGPRSTPIAPTRRSPPAASVGRRFDRCRRWFFRTVVEKRRFRPFFRDFPIFFPPPTGPCASEVKAAWHRDAPRPPASAAGSPAWYAVGIFCGGRKTAFRRLWGLPPNPPIRAPSPGVDFRSSPLGGVRRRRPRPNRTPFGDSTSRKPPSSGHFCCVTRIPATVTVAHRELCGRPAGRRSPPASAVARSRPDVQPTTTSSSPNRK
jgi:hypothetical protein